jgi:nitroreductase
MDFFKVIEGRHSVRSYADKPIPADKLQQILEAINRAPSAGNGQAFEVYLVRGAGQRTALVQAGNDQDFLGQAPIVLVFCTHAGLDMDRYGQRGAELYCIQDATIACTFAMLAASALGLSTVWVGAFDEDAVRDIICAPQTERPVAMLPIGYAAETPRIRPRRDLGALVHDVQ